MERGDDEVEETTVGSVHSQPRLSLRTAVYSRAASICGNTVYTVVIAISCTDPNV